jgi:spermidine/putrescine transport system substrate-binding protein
MGQDNDAAAEIARRITETFVTRRTLLRGIGFGAVALGSGALTACGTSGGAATAADKTVRDLSATEKKVIFANWPDYIDVKGQKRPSIDTFEQRTGISVSYEEDINDNDQFFGKIRPQLAAGKATGRDIVTLTDWMAARMIRLNYVQKLDKANIPNAKNLSPALQHPSFDANRDYTLPWQSGLTGIGYNKKQTGPVTNFTDLLTNKKLHGKVTALTEMRDTVGLLMLEQGKDPADFTDDDFANAIDMLQKAVSDGQIRKFTGNEYIKGLASGEIVACFAWSGDVFQTQPDNPAVTFAVPEAGCMIWSDNMMIPNKATHKANAEKLMNYYYDPQVAAILAAWVNYICPVEGAQEAMKKVDKSLVDSPLIFPTSDMLSKTHIFKGLTSDEEKRYTDMFTAVTGA